MVSLFNVLISDHKAKNVNGLAKLQDQSFFCDENLLQSYSLDDLTHALLSLFEHEKIQFPLNLLIKKLLFTNTIRCLNTLLFFASEMKPVWW